MVEEYDFSKDKPGINEKRHKKKLNKNRLDAEVAARGLAESAEKAKALIMAGDILVNGQVNYKADFKVTEEHRVELKEKSPYASRGAVKIEKAFREFNVRIEGCDVLDIGISTGGFTDYMLQKGARNAAGVDVNVQQVDYKLQNHPNLKLIQKNARHLEFDDVGFQPHIITIDVSFISVTKILPALAAFPGAKIISLIKPQFEARRQDVDKGGILRDREKHIELLLELKQKIQQLNYAVTGLTLAGVKGRKGNQEYFFLLEYGKKQSINDTMITHAVKL